MDKLDRNFYVPLRPCHECEVGDRVGLHFPETVEVVRVSYDAGKNWEEPSLEKFDTIDIQDNIVTFVPNCAGPLWVGAFRS